ncbi:MAG TPA: TOBE-like domain-containing protein, partial [Kofleriaceae bacterium]|nr:TOBE-like domain-containing protein [Kofleriaceae bacterium]
ERSLAATIVHINPTGSMVKVELRAIDFDAIINAEVPADRFAELALEPGDKVHISPRRVRVFSEPIPVQEEVNC